MAKGRPRIAVWSEHALAKAELLGIPRAHVEDAVLSGYSRRIRNTGAADWLVEVGRLRVAYNHPDEADELIARIVTLWRRA